MGAAVAKLVKYRQLMGMAVAALILTVIFVPFQSATAFTVTTDLPNDDDDTISRSASGEPFEITIDVEAAELISIESIELILDNDEASVKTTVFDDTGARTSGSTDLVVGNEVEIDSSGSLNSYGYAYGYGLVSSGSTFSSPFSYAFSSTTDFLGGNTAGYSFSVAGTTDDVVGLIGPGTITITGTLRTTDLAEGSHTLDVLIDTGGGGNDEDQLVAPQLAFDVEDPGDLVVLEEEVTAGETEVEFEITGFEIEGEPVTVSFSFGAPTTTTGDAILSFQLPGGFFDSLSDADTFSLDLSGGDVTLTDEDGDEFLIAGLIADLDLSALGLPDGTEITIGIGPYDDSDLSADEEDDLRLFHFNDDTDEWGALTNDDLTINGGDEVDTDANIVYGTTDDFSVFAPATPTAGGGGGGGGVSVNRGGQTVYVGILPESFLVDNPLLRVQIHDSALLNAAGERITSVRAGEQITIAGTFKNNQGQSQNYAFIVQIVNEEGITTDIGWLTGSLESQEILEGSRSWLASDSGEYTVRIFVWDSVEAPTALAEVAERTFRVS